MCKKLLSILLAVFLCVPASAETDYSAMTAEELIALYRDLNAQMTDLRQEMQDVAFVIMQKRLYPVTVPAGVWEIGVDIPAGLWRMSSMNVTTITYGDQLDRAMFAIDQDRCTYYLQHTLYGPKSGLMETGSDAVTINLEEGFFLAIEGEALFFIQKSQVPTPFTFHE